MIDVFDVTRNPSSGEDSYSKSFANQHFLRPERLTAHWWQVKSEAEQRLQERLDELDHMKKGTRKAIEKAVAKWKDGSAKGMEAMCFRALKENRIERRNKQAKRNSVEICVKKFLLGQARGVLSTCWLNWKKDALESQRLAAEHKRFEDFLDGERAKMRCHFWMLPAVMVRWKLDTAMPRFITEWKAWSTGDVVAGITVAVTSLPQYIAYAELAQLSGFRGIVASGPPLVAFAFLTGNPCLNIGVTSITALMATADLKGAEYREAYGEAAWSQILGTYSMMIGVASIALACLGAGRLVKHIPSPVKAGWKLGFALAAFAAQTPSSTFQHAKHLKKICSLPNLNGGPLSGGAANMYRLGWTLTHPHFWDAEAILFSAMTLFIFHLSRGGCDVDDRQTLRFVQKQAETFLNRLMDDVSELSRSSESSVKEENIAKESTPGDQEGSQKRKREEAEEEKILRGAAVLEALKPRAWRKTKNKSANSEDLGHAFQESIEGDCGNSCGCHHFVATTVSGRYRGFTASWL
eukprot:symbB.v1.2.008404.t1/scaffold526.1/size209645/5